MQKKYKIIITAFLLLNIFGWIIQMEVSYGIPQIIKYIFSVSILGILIWYRLINPAKPVPGGLFNVAIIVFVGYSSLLLLIAIFESNSIFFVQMALAIPYYYIPYLLPVLLLYTKFDLGFFSHLFYYSYILIIPVLIIQFLVIATGLSQENWGEQAKLIMLFDIACFFLLFTGHLAKKKYIFNLTLAYYLVWFFLWTYYGRRGMMIENILLLIMTVIIRLKSSSLHRSARFKMYFSILVVAMLLLVFGYLFSSTYAFQRGFDSSAFESSRGSAFEAFFYDFRSTTDWVFGRGLDGTILRSLNTFSEYSSVENGFLTILLKGGLLFTIPFLVILLRASYLGFFKTNNDLTRALASYILVFLVIMGYFNLPEYSNHYIFLWIAVSGCFASSLRSYRNEDISNAINSHFKKG